jgi:glucose/arabinose dehydrogenase
MRLEPERRLLVAALTAGALIWSSGRVEAQIRARLHASGFTNPIAFVQDPDNRNVQFVVEQGGRIRVVRDRVVLGADFLDLTADVLSGGERGLLGMAFAPQTGGTRFFVNFTNRSGDTVVARFRRSAGALTADAASRFDLRWGGPGGPASIAQPFPNHNGGNLAFGPDGYLYIGLGDGGFGNDPGHRAQNPQELLGKMLRIDVNVADSHPSGYQIPGDNPFVAGQGSVAARPEIWSFGWRNPWRYSFDDPGRGGTGALVAGDVGQSGFEEIDYEPRGRGGRNYGWRNREGMHDNVTSLPPAYTPLIDPIFEYGRASGQSVTGGVVYRGQGLPATYQGRYFFADFVSGRIWSIALTINSTTGEATAAELVDHTTQLGALGSISSFGVDTDGEAYVVGYSQGSVFKIVGPPPTPAGLRIIR